MFRWISINEWIIGKKKLLIQVVIDFVIGMRLMTVGNIERKQRNKRRRCIFNKLFQSRLTRWYLLFHRIYPLMKEYINTLVGYILSIFAGIIFTLFSSITSKNPTEKFRFWSPTLFSTFPYYFYFYSPLSSGLQHFQKCGYMFKPTLGRFQCFAVSTLSAT